MTEDPSDQGPRALEDLVFEFLETSDGDAAPSETLDKMCAAHPELAPRLRAAIERLAGSGFAVEDDGPGPSSQDRTVGRYRLHQRLGSGGMGVVYLASCVGSDGPDVALKLLQPRERYEPSAKARFSREALAVSSLDHPSIVRVLDHGEWDEDGVQTPFLAMEYHRGTTLDRFLVEASTAPPGAGDGEELGARLHRLANTAVDPLGRASSMRGPWWRVVCQLGVSLASALAHAHGRGVIHRDIKPSNVLMTEDGRPLLLDFGLATMTGSGRLTASGAWLGSLPYMAPERLAPGVRRSKGQSQQASEPDARSDVYALGLVLHELLSLEPTFPPQGKDALAVAVMGGAKLAPSARFPWLASAPHKPLDAVLARATERLPKHRYRSATELARDLKALLDGRPPGARPVAMTTRALRAVARHPWRAATGTLLILLALGAPLLTSHLNAGFNRDLQIEEERSELEEIQARLASFESGLLALSRTSIGVHPRFAPSAIDGLEEARTDLVSAKARLRDRQDPESQQLVVAIDSLLAIVLIEIADARQTLGEFSAAVDAYGAHRRHVEEILEVRGPDLHFSTELGRSWGQLARSLMAADREEPALQEAQKSVAIFEEAKRAGYRPAVTEDQLCAARMILTGGLWRSGRLEEAVELLEETQSEFLGWTGPDPEDLRSRARLAEIEAQRARWGLVPLSSGERLAAMDRAAAWIDGAREPFENSVTTALIRMDIEVSAILALDNMGRTGEALERANWLETLAAKLCAARGEPGGAHEPLQRALVKAQEIAAVARLRAGEHGAAIGHLRRLYEESRAAYLEQPNEATRLVEFSRTAGNYSNQLVLTEALGPERLGLAVRAATDALKWLAESELEHRDFATTRRLCHYARGIAEGQRGRRDPAARDAQAVLDLSAPDDAYAFRMAADVWSELLAADPGAPPAEEARLQTLQLLERAIDAGYVDLHELEDTEALGPLRSDSRFLKILDRLR